MNSSSRQYLHPNPEWDCILSAAQKNLASEILRLVEKCGVSPNHTNVAGQSPLHIAALWGNGTLDNFTHLVDTELKFVNLKQ